MAGEDVDKELGVGLRTPEIKPVVTSETTEHTESPLQEKPRTEELQELQVELATTASKVKQDEPVAPSSVSESGATYGKTYAEIAKSRFGKGLLANHGKVIIAESLKSGVPDGASILEIGCNTGMLMEQLAIDLKDKSPKISGIDFNRDAVEIAKQNGFDASFGDAQNLENIPSNSEDVIYSLHTFEHIPNISKAFKELQRILKPGGKACIIVPPNMYGLETVRVAAEDLPEDKKGKGLLGGIKTFFNAWSYARKLHCSNLGGPFGGARSHAERILKTNNIDLKVSGGMRPDLKLANLLVFEKPTSPTS